MTIWFKRASNGIIDAMTGVVPEERRSIVLGFFQVNVSGKLEELLNSFFVDQATYYFPTALSLISLLSTCHVSSRAEQNSHYNTVVGSRLRITLLVHRSSHFLCSTK
jgi:hypothetical protein